MDLKSEYGTKVWVDRRCSKSDWNLKWIEIERLYEIDEIGRNPLLDGVMTVGSVIYVLGITIPKGI